MENNGGRQFVLSLQTVILGALLVIIIVLFALLGSMPQTSESFRNVEDVTDEYILFQNSVFALKKDVNEFSDRTKAFIVSHDLEDVVLYFNEKQMSQLRRQSPTDPENNITDKEALHHLQSADDLSERLMHEQSYAMRLILEADGQPEDTYPTALRSIQLNDIDKALAPKGKEQRAKDIIFGPACSTLLDQINTQLKLYNDTVTEIIFNKQISNESRLKMSVSSRQQFILLMMGILLLVMLFIFLFVLKPINTLITNIRYGQLADDGGAYELQFLADTYNQYRQKMDEVNQKLIYDASHDTLTGLFNRGAYEKFNDPSGKANVALIIIDVDNFKEINDTYGHEIGDKVLARVGQVLRHSFREGDKACRMGGDEFSILMQGIDSTKVDIVRNKVALAARILAEPEKDVPAITISVGVAFSDCVIKRENLFRAADFALYKIKQNGRNGCGFYTGGAIDKTPG